MLFFGLVFSVSLPGKFSADTPLVEVSSIKRRSSETVNMDGGWELFYSGADSSVSAQADAHDPPVVKLCVRLVPLRSWVCILKLKVENQSICLLQVYRKGVGRKISRGMANEKSLKKYKKKRKIALLSLFHGGPTVKKDRKIAKKNEKNSTIKSLSTIFVPCMKTQGGHGPPLPTPKAPILRRLRIRPL